jgi:hypothetical protein
MLPLIIDKKSNNMVDRAKHSRKIRVVFLVPLILFLGLNSLQLFSNWAVWSETRRLESLATHSTDEFQNPAPVADHFAGKLSPDFWNFSIINGGGRVARASAWHAASMIFEDGLTIHHFPDPAFHDEDSFLHRKPAAGRYNKVSLIGGRGFRPTPSNDIVLKFNS